MVYLVVFLGPGWLSAYSIPSHRLLTRTAAIEYNICAASTNLKPVTSAQIRRIISGNIGEDFDYSVKAFNWHYYHPAKELGAADFGFGSASLTPHFKRLEASILRGPDAYKLGRLIHYVQDLTVPVHVAPIYHSIDSFDVYSTKSIPPPLPTSAECALLFDPENLRKSYFNILDEVARETIKRMGEKFSFAEGGESKEISWKEAFWNIRGGKHNFGKYGSFGNHFGDLQIGDRHISAEVYEAFARRQFDLAVKATVIFLAKFQASRGASGSQTQNSIATNSPTVSSSNSNSYSPD